jgi:hypothetical protein
VNSESLRIVIVISYHLSYSCFPATSIKLLLAIISFR